MELSTEFITRTKALFGEERFARFESALNTDPVVSIRYNRNKTMHSGEGAPVLWASDAEYLDNRPLFTADPLFHAGCYYVQEASSMFLEQVIRQYVKSPVKALDLCAAPGGKSTHLLSVLPKGSMLVANEPVSQRTQVLAENIIKWGNPAAVVTRNEPADFAELEDFFDFMLIDAPCSGEGMFRKDAFAVEQWSVNNVELCVKRQRAIIADVWPALRPGGLLVYSTCTFNSAENEECVQWMAEELGAEVLSLNVFEDWNVTGNLVGGTFPVYRFIPGYTNGEGFFLSVLRKNGSCPPTKKRRLQPSLCPSKIKAMLQDWVVDSDKYDFILQNENVTAFPKENTSAFAELNAKLRCVHTGLPVASLKHNKPMPVHALAMSVAVNSSAFEKVELEREQALAYLHRETLSLQNVPLGIVLLTYKNTPLGFAKNVGSRANNLYPSEWRIRKNPIEL